MLATPRDDKQVDAIERLTKTKIARQTMENLEVREDRKPRRDGDKGRGHSARERNRKDKFRPDKFHDHVAPMQPAQVVDAIVAPPAAPVAHAPEPRPVTKHEPHREQQRPPHKKREPEHRASHDRKNDASPVRPEKHQLPAFLFRPVPLPKKADAEG
jgi:superfamily II DNA/RNA helicase